MDLVQTNKVLFLFIFPSQKKFFPISFLPLFLFKKRRRREEVVEEENQHILAFLSFSSVSFPSPKGKEEEKKEEKSSFMNCPKLYGQHKKEPRALGHGFADTVYLMYGGYNGQRGHRHTYKYVRLP